MRNLLKINNKRDTFLHYKILKILKPNKVVLAGGALRKVVDDKELIEDFDIFFLDKDYIEKAKSTLEDIGFQLVFQCEKKELFTYKIGKLKVQLIIPKIYGSYENLLYSFDFNACMACYDGDNMYFTSSFVKSVKRKILTINEIEYPIATMSRIQKYKNKGYNISEAMKSFCEIISKSDYNPEADRLYID